MGERICLLHLIVRLAHIQGIKAFIIKSSFDLLIHYAPNAFVDLWTMHIKICRSNISVKRTRDIQIIFISGLASLNANSLKCYHSVLLCTKTSYINLCIMNICKFNGM